MQLRMKRDTVLSVDGLGEVAKLVAQEIDAWSTVEDEVITDEALPFSDEDDQGDEASPCLVAPESVDDTRSTDLCDDTVGLSGDRDGAEQEQVQHGDEAMVDVAPVQEPPTRVAASIPLIEFEVY